MDTGIIMLIVVIILSAASTGISLYLALDASKTYKHSKKKLEEFILEKTIRDAARETLKNNNYYYTVDDLESFALFCYRTDGLHDWTFKNWLKEKNEKLEGGK
jgi:hypothetical protein